MKIPLRLIIILIILGLIGLGGYAVLQQLQQPETTTTNTVPIKPNYTALGDSISAGAGLIDPLDSSACDRSKQSYPVLIAQQLNATLSHYGCSGALLTSGVLQTQTVNDLTLKPQVQRLASQESKPELVTVTAGVNDTGWTDILARCFQSTCGKASDTADFTNSLSGIETNLQKLFEQLTIEASGAKVVVSGYYHLFSNSSPACPDVSGLDSNERNWWIAQTDRLNKTIESSTKKYPSVHFVGIDFENHELCSETPWVQGVNDDTPFHPTEQGQQIIAESLLRIHKAF